MKIKLQKNALVAGLSQAADIISNRATMPMLECVLLKTDGNSVSIRSTNLDMEISSSIAAHVSVEGEVLIQARKSLAIIKQLASEDLVISYDGKSNRCVIESGSSRYRLAAISAGDFPVRTEVKGSIASFQCNQEVLKNGLAVVQPCASSDENRYILNSCLLDTAEGQCTLVATDGRRLACIDLELDISMDLAHKTILPLPLVKKLIAVLGIGEITTISVSDRQIKVCIQTKEDNKEGLIGDIVIVSKVVEGKYPNYQQVMPKDDDYTRIDINREGLLKSVNRVALMVDDKQKGGGGVRFDTKEKSMKISANNNVLGQSEEEVELVEVVPEISVAINPLLFKDMVNCLSFNNIILKIKDSMSPIIIYSGDKGYVGVIMPLRL